MRLRTVNPPLLTIVLLCCSFSSFKDHFDTNKSETCLMRLRQVRDKFETSERQVKSRECFLPFGEKISSIDGSRHFTGVLQDIWIFDYQYWGHFGFCTCILSISLTMKLERAFEKTRLHKERPNYHNIKGFNILLVINNTL